MALRRFRGTGARLLFGLTAHLLAHHWRPISTLNCRRQRLVRVPLCSRHLSSEQQVSLSATANRRRFPGGGFICSKELLHYRLSTEHRFTFTCAIVAPLSDSYSPAEIRWIFDQQLVSCFFQDCSGCLHHYYNSLGAV